MEVYFLPTKITTQVISCVVKDMATALKSGREVVFTKATGRKTKGTDSVNLSMQTVTFTKEIGGRIQCTGKVHSSMPMVTFTKANGRPTIGTGMA